MIKTIFEIVELIRMINVNTIMRINHEIDQNSILIAVHDCYGLIKRKELNFESSDWEVKSEELLNYLRQLLDEEQKGGGT